MRTRSITLENTPTSPRRSKAAEPFRRRICVVASDGYRLLPAAFTATVAMLTANLAAAFGLELSVAHRAAMPACWRALAAACVFNLLWLVRGTHPSRSAPALRGAA